MIPKKKTLPTYCEASFLNMAVGNPSHGDDFPVNLHA